MCVILHDLKSLLYVILHVRCIVLQQQQSVVRSDGAPDIAPSELEFDAETDFVGKGVFGRVYKGRCRGQVVAIKVPLNVEVSAS